MNIQTILNSGLTEVLAESLLHSLWQATVIGLVYLLFLKTLPANKSSLRCRLGLFSLLAVLLCWLGTLSILNRQPKTTNPVIAAANDTPAQVAVSSSAAKSVPLTGTFQTTHQEVLIVDTPKAKTKISAHTILILLWSLGVVLMTIRLFIALTGTRRHRSKALPIDDSALLARFQKLCDRLGINRKMIFAATTTLKSPGVIGIVKPMVLIPASVLTGFSTSDLEAVVAHELAHIKRHDYLFNLLQMVIESIFFFNPAVWWISRRVRLEREVCCDAAAMQVTGQQFEYANLLLNEFGGTPATVPAFGNHKKDAAKERLLRIVHPHKRFDIKISALRLLLLLALTTTAIVALAKTSDLAVETVAKIMSPKERVEKLIELADKTPKEDQVVHAYGSPETLVAGIVRTFDGAPLPKQISVWSRSYNVEGQSASHGIRVDEQGRFLGKVKNLGHMMIFAHAEGYAPSFTKASRVAAGESLEGVEITLHAGSPLIMNIRDETGNPIIGAKVSASYMHLIKQRYKYLHQESTTSDVDGTARIEHAIPFCMRFSVEADGFQPLDNIDLETHPGTPLSFTMKKGLAAEGVVVDAETGAPIPNATFRLMHRDKPGHGWNYGQEGKDAGTTDAEGRIAFNTWAPDTTYTYLVEAEGHPPVRLEKVDTNTFPSRIELGPERIIRGTVIGDLNKLGTVSDFHDIWVHFDKGFKYTAFTLKDGKRNYQNQSHGIVEVTIKDEVGHFELKNILGDEIILRSSDSVERAVLSLNPKDTDDIVIDLDSGATTLNTPHRIVEFAFETPAGFPPVNGEINVWRTTQKRKDAGDNSWTGKKITIIDGEGRASFDAPGYVRLASCDAFAGYWVDKQSSTHSADDVIQPGDAPYRVTYQANPCGGIEGRILDSNGAPVADASLSIFPVYTRLAKQKGESAEAFRRRSREQNQFFSRPLSHSKPRSSQSGTFSFTSLLLNKTYVVIVECRNALSISDRITVNEENPIPYTTIRLPAPKTVAGRVLNPDGTPAANIAIELDKTIAVDDVRRGRADMKTLTDDDGRFEFDGILPHPYIDYTLKLKTDNETAPVNQIAEPGKEVVIQLQKALSIKGRVVDNDTDHPIEGIIVSTGKQHAKHEIAVSAETDSEGRFSLSPLSAAEYVIGVKGMEITSPPTTNVFFTTFTAGEVDFIELKVKPMTNWPPAIQL